MSKELNNINLTDKRIAPDGKEIVSLENYLSMKLRHPVTWDETLRLNCASILRLLGVSPSGAIEVKRTAAWLRAGYRASGREKIWKVMLVDAQLAPYHVV
jgi:hypothetical protein